MYDREPTTDAPPPHRGGQDEKLFRYAKEDDYEHSIRVHTVIIDFSRGKWYLACGLFLAAALFLCGFITLILYMAANYPGW